MSTRFAIAALAAVSVGNAAFAFEERDGGNLTVDHVFQIGTPGVLEGIQNVTTYSNVTHFTGIAWAAGGADVVAGNAITRLVADDLTFSGLWPGQNILGFQFSVANLNTVAVSVRPRVRFWHADGVTGGPGTYYTGNIGYTFAPITFGPGVTVVTATVGPGFLNPAGTMWAGITFDNNTGATGATVDQLNNFGVGLFNPPTVGSSTDRLFATDAAGSFFAPNNPAGTFVHFNANPMANAGWSFRAVPEPGTMIALAAGLGVLAAHRRRRK
jgi:hypothetical protein